MSRLLVLIGLAVFLWICLEIAWARLRALLGTGAVPPRRPPEIPAETLVRCAGCGVHVPRSLAVVQAGRPLCDRCRSREARA